MSVPKIIFENEISKWKQIRALGGSQTSPLPTSPSQVPLYHRYESLDVECRSVEDVDDSPFTAEVSPRSERPTPRITTTSMGKKRWVIVVGNSLLRGPESPTCWANSSSGESAACRGSRLCSSGPSLLIPPELMDCKTETGEGWGKSLPL